MTIATTASCCGTRSRGSPPAGPVRRRAATIRCPCGSGRKYKACHLGRETHSLDDRAGWLYQKASRFLRDRRPLATEELAGLVVDEIGQRELVRRAGRRAVPA